MKIFLIKTSIVIFAIFILFQITIAPQINKIKNLFLFIKYDILKSYNYIKNFLYIFFKIRVKII